MPMPLTAAAGVVLLVTGPAPADRHRSTATSMRTAPPREAVRRTRRGRR
ncbi:hypothetical protein [Amnibacterium kyonggiense]